jgi:hypothetical protein
MIDKNDIFATHVGKLPQVRHNTKAACAKAKSSFPLHAITATIQPFSRSPEVAETTLTLDYASRQSWIRRRWLRVSLIILLLAAAIAGAWYRNDITWAFRRGLLLRTQRQCMAFDAKPIRVVYEEDATKARELLTQKDYRPDTLDVAGQQTGAMYWPSEVQNYPEASRYFSGGNGFNNNAALLFLHERKTASGQSVLVCALAWMDKSGGDSIVRFAVRAVSPGNWRTDPGIVGGLGAFPIEVVRYYPQRPLRIYAGQPDANDASRFTVEYELRGSRGVLEGRVRDIAKQTTNVTVEIDFDVRSGGPSR